MDVRPGPFVITPDESIRLRSRGLAEPCLGYFLHSNGCHNLKFWRHLQDSGHNHFHITTHNFIIF